MTPKVSVIIAIYKVEDYIERCLHTLFGQTLDSIEYIFVDDASPDSSIDIIEKVLELYPFRKPQVKIIRHSENQGIALARTSGILAATGEYMIHCDPDDYVETDIYEELYSEAIKTNADIVVCDYWWEKGNLKLLRSIRYEKDAKKNLLNMNKGHLFIGGSLWNFLTRRSIIINNKIFPYPHADFAEDGLCRIKTLYYSDICSLINKPLYHYCIRSNSITGSAISTQQFQYYTQNINEIIKFFYDKGDFKNLANLLKLHLKFLVRHLYRGRDEKGWFNLYKESHVAIFKYKEMTLMQRLFWAVAFTNYQIFKIGLVLYIKIKGYPF